MTTVYDNMQIVLIHIPLSLRHIENGGIGEKYLYSILYIHNTPNGRMDRQAPVVASRLQTAIAFNILYFFFVHILDYAYA